MAGECERLEPLLVQKCFISQIKISCSKANIIDLLPRERRLSHEQLAVLVLFPSPL